jgi:hypothetical protein
MDFTATHFPRRDGGVLVAQDERLQALWRVTEAVPVE